MDDLTPVRLRDGTEAFVVPLLPANRETPPSGQEYVHLSAQTRFDRFLSAVPKLTDTMLDRLVDEVDGADHVAWYYWSSSRRGPSCPWAWHGSSAIPTTRPSRASR